MIASDPRFFSTTIRLPCQLALLIAGAVIVGCGGGGPSPQKDAPADARDGAAVDAPVDAVPDAAVDAPVDAPIESADAPTETPLACEPGMSCPTENDICQTACTGPFQLECTCVSGGGGLSWDCTPVDCQGDA